MSIFRKIRDFLLKSKLRLAVFLIITFLMLASFWSVTSNKKTQTSGVGAPAPTKALSVAEQQSLEQSKTILISKLPIDTGEYLIEYFPDRNYFFVQIRKNPYQQYKQQIEDIFKQNGIDPNYVSIEWGSVRGVGP